MIAVECFGVELGRHHGEMMVVWAFRPTLYRLVPGRGHSFLQSSSHHFDQVVSLVFYLLMKVFFGLFNVLANGGVFLGAMLVDH